MEPMNDLEKILIEKAQKEAGEIGETTVEESLGHAKTVQTIIDTILQIKKS